MPRINHFEIQDQKTEITPEKEKPALKPTLLSWNLEKPKKEFSEIDVLIQEKLFPKVEKDQAGYNRIIYRFNDITFSFKGREELPVYNTLKNSYSVFLGEKPKWISDEAFEEWLKELKLTQNKEGSQKHYLVNKTLVGLLELAIRLGAKDPSLQQLKEDVEKGIYSEKALNLIDALIALNYVDLKSNSLRTKPNQNAEAILLLSLLEDSICKNAIRKATEILKKLIKKKRKKGIISS